MSKENTPQYYAVNYESSAPRTYIAIKDPDSNAIEWRSYLGIQQKLILNVIATAGPTTKVGGPGYEIDHDTFAVLTANVTHAVVVANRLIPEKYRKIVGDNTASSPPIDDMVKTISIDDLSEPSVRSISAVQQIGIPRTSQQNQAVNKEDQDKALIPTG